MKAACGDLHSNFCKKMEENEEKMMMMTKSIRLFLRWLVNHGLQYPGAKTRRLKLFFLISTRTEEEERKKEEENGDERPADQRSVTGTQMLKLALEHLRSHFHGN